MLRATVFLLVVIGAVLGRNLQRIVGGQDAEVGQGKYQVSLRTLMNQHFCGGAILSASWVVTAGHCTLGKKPGEFLAAVGSRSVNDGLGYRVDYVFRHPSFDAHTLTDDIALLETEAPIVFSDLVQPAVLGQRIIPEGLEALLTGWGQQVYPGSVSSTLQALSMVTMSNEECRKKHSVDPYSPPIRDTNICAIRENAGACMGDSGSPLVLGNELVGIVSWGVPCAQNFGDVFTRISAYREWIIESISAKEM
ncbi:chymotrypsin-1-like [Phlebotomus argentipes]|uniref:chymotrypsin-1-like n=1 Tax=Phlebotomus argentipes TaxID=94469 RepID=UPI0028936ED3|nr:chymotrypsin-1-like [Phlebotomus argentipes]